MTRYIARLCRDTRFWTLQITELMLFFVLLRSKIIQAKHASLLYIQAGLIYLNGRVCTQANFNIQGGDIVQVVYSYEALVYNDILQQSYLQQFLQNIFYFITEYKHKRELQHERLQQEQIQHARYLQELRTKRGHHVVTRFALLGEYLQLHKQLNRREHLTQAYDRWCDIQVQAAQPLDTFLRRVYFLKSANDFLK